MLQKANGKNRPRSSGSGGTALVGDTARAERAGRGNSETEAFLELVADCVQRIAAGAAPPKITHPYAGTVKQGADGLNAIIDLMHARSADLDELIKAALE